MKRKYIVYSSIMDCNHEIKLLTEKQADIFRNSGYIVELLERG